MSAVVELVKDLSGKDLNRSVRSRAACSPRSSSATALPTKVAKIFTTAEDNQPPETIQVYRGDVRWPAKSKSLGNFELTGLSPAPRRGGTFEISPTRHRARECQGLDHRQGAADDGDRGSALPRDQIDRMVREAKQYAEENCEHREAVQSCNQVSGVANHHN